ncbi:hypothetical protein ABZ807_11600 [Micromonospora sp. NPDC047548]|uniref:hypothetical protein n=1 Tax=Micromonospora sp. NPDC047548 TaxID=3155624 RepID=UPI0033DFAAF8
MSATTTPLLPPLLLLAVVPKGAAAVTTARIKHRADFQNISDNHLRYLLRYYSTDRRRGPRRHHVRLPHQLVPGDHRPDQGHPPGRGPPPCCG